METLVWIVVILGAPVAVLGGCFTVRDMLRDLRVVRDEKRMARDYGARMTRPLSEAERDAVAAWLRDRREGD